MNGRMNDRMNEMITVKGHEIESKSMVLLSEIDCFCFEILQPTTLKPIINVGSKNFQKK